MKSLILLEIANRLKNSSKLRKKLKIFIVVGALGLVLIGTLVVWAGFAGLRYVSKLANEPTVATQVGDLQTEIQKLPALLNAGCWSTAQSLINVAPWLERPIADNFTSLKVACLDRPEPSCKGADCGAVKKGIEAEPQSEAI